MDAIGVSLAASQGLYPRVPEQQATIEALQQQNVELEARLAALEKRVQGPLAAGIGGGLLPGVGFLGLAAAVVAWLKRR